mgnify:CR=1 FL=1
MTGKKARITGMKSEHQNDGNKGQNDGKGQNDMEQHNNMKEG